MKRFTNGIQTLLAAFVLCGVSCLFVFEPGCSKPATPGKSLNTLFSSAIAPALTPTPCPCGSYYNFNTSAMVCNDPCPTPIRTLTPTVVPTNVSTVVPTNVPTLAPTPWTTRTPTPDSCPCGSYYNFNTYTMVCNDPCPTPVVTLIPTVIPPTTVPTYVPPTATVTSTLTKTPTLVATSTFIPTPTALPGTPTPCVPRPGPGGLGGCPTSTPTPVGSLVPTLVPTVVPPTRVPTTVPTIAGTPTPTWDPCAPHPGPGGGGSGCTPTPAPYVSPTPTPRPTSTSTPYPTRTPTPTWVPGVPTPNPPGIPYNNVGIKYSVSFPMIFTVSNATVGEYIKVTFTAPGVPSLTKTYPVDMAPTWVFNITILGYPVGTSVTTQLFSTTGTMLQSVQT